jgi:DNA-binding NtrC family response regulator
MTKLSNIQVLVCSQDPKHATFISKSLVDIGLQKIFIAGSQEQLRRICDNNKIDIALIDTKFNGTGGFVTGELLINQFPEVFLIYITDPKQIMDPIKSIFSGAVDFIVKDDSKEFIQKVSLWSQVACNSLKARAYLNG